MSKYSDKFKLKIVEEYLNGTLGYTLLARKYSIPSRSVIQTWVNQDQINGEEGLQAQKTNNKYALPFKLDVLRFKQDTGASYKETANAFGIAEPSIIANWKRAYLKEGAPSLNKTMYFFIAKHTCFKTIYNYIHRGNFFIRPIDLPVMITLKTRRNKHSKPKGTNKRILGRSISTRPTSVNERESFGHWEADLMEGKIGKNEPVVLTLLERLTRFGISRKLPNGKSDTIQQALLEITTEKTEAFSSITFDNGSEFSQASAFVFCNKEVHSFATKSTQCCHPIFSI